MTHREPSRTAPRRIRVRRPGAAALLLGIVAIAAVLVSRSGLSLPSTASALSTAASPPVLAGPGPGPRGEPRGALGEAGGAVPGGTTVFDGAVPGVARLDHALLRALRRAATDGAADGIQFVVNSGWRSAAYEDQLRREAIARYGSEAEAARWVATGTTSPHVSGAAVDMGSGAATWLAGHGAAYGLCRIYGNEPWHYELRSGAIAHGCPSPYADPTQTRACSGDPTHTHGDETNMTRRLRTPVALGLAGVIGLTTVGCGSNAAPRTGTARSGANTTLTARDKAVRFAECIRAHDVSDFPDPDAKNEFQYGVSVSPAVWKRATTACKALQPPGTLSSKRTPAQQSASLRFAQCIRDHGVKDFPDPVNGEPAIDTYKIPSSHRPGGMTILNAAIDACKRVLGLGAGGQG